MKATDLLTSQHREVADLFGRLEGHVGAREAEAVVRELATVLGAHMAIEQEIFYPECAAHMDDREVARHGFEEHAEALTQLRKVLAMPGDDEAFKPEVQKLREAITHHVKEEENGLFRKADPIIGDKQLELLGAQMEARFDEAVELGYEVTTAEGAVDPDDVDQALAKYNPTGQRIAPAVAGEHKVRKNVPAAARNAAARLEEVTSVPPPHEGGRHPKSGAEGVRKTREGPRGSGDIHGERK